MSSTEMQEIETKKRRGSGSSASSSKHSSHVDKDVEEGDHNDDPEVSFIQPNHAEPEDKMAMPPPTIEFSGLTKDELMKFASDPFWKKVRWVLFILFWVLWVGMLVAAILIIVLTPKCPKIPKRTFWQKSSGYHVDVATFKDSDGDGIGDIQGVVEKIDYLKTKGGFLVLSSVLAGSLGDKKTRSTSITNFQKVDSAIGTMESVKTLMKKCRQNGLKALIEFPAHTGKEHEWFKKALTGTAGYQNYYIWKKSAPTTKMVNRVGQSVWNEGIKDFYYWSSLHSSLPALNLNNTDVLKKLSNAVTFWLTEGFDGIFIDNAAFLAPEIDTTNLGSGLSLSATEKLANWYKTGHNGQLYTRGSVKFIQEVRTWVDAVQKKTDRERLLLVSSGNTGLKQDREKTLAYLGEAESPGAHSVMLFDLVPKKGAKVVGSKSSLRAAVDDAVKTNASVMTVTQTVSGPRVNDLIRTCLNLLLPTTGLTVYGEEIGMTGYGVNLPTEKMFPKPAYWYITQAAMPPKSTFKDDLVDSYDAPMQWKLEGGFSTANATSKKTYPTENVMSLSTIGRGQTRLDVFNSVVKLSKEHSLNWGEFQWLEVVEEEKLSYYMFTRAAKGFAKYIVVVMKPTKEKGGRARDLSKVCKEATPVLSFPSNVDFKADKVISMTNVYFHFDLEGSVYIFKCKK